MHSAMEDPHVRLVGPYPREPLPLASYDLQLSPGSTARIVGVHSPLEISPSLIAYLTREMNHEIERGDTYPMTDPFTPETFTSYFFGNFACIMVDITTEKSEFWKQDHAQEFWGSVILGAFYIKPNYPGRCSHVCNAGFLVPAAVRGRGSGRHLAMAFLHFAPKLGYKSSIFNLVFATNVASIRIWENLGFERVGIVKGAGVLKGYTELIDAYIYGYQFPEEDSRAEEGMR